MVGFENIFSSEARKRRMRSRLVSSSLRENGAEAKVRLIFSSLRENGAEAKVRLIHYRGSGRWVSKALATLATLFPNGNSVCCGEFGLKFLLLVLVPVLVLLGLFRASPSFSQSNSIMINEFMPDPAESDEATKPNGEWIELYNRAGSKDLAGWVLKDKYDNHILEIIPENTDTGGTVIAEGGYLVVYRNGDKDFSLNQDDDQIRLFDDGGNLVDSVLYSGSVGEGKSWSLRSTEWVRNTDPTPGAENSFPKEGTKDQQTQPTISFSAPSSVVVGKMFSVQVMLTGFEPGSYHVKVLIAKGENLNYGEMNVSGRYGAWETMPLVKVGQTTTVQTKTDQDIEPGNYDIRIRVQYNCVGKSYCESGAKPLKVAGSEKPGGTSGALGGEELGSDNAEGILGEVAIGEGKVLGEESPKGEGFKLNFYTILGIFGMLVGSGGLILSFAKKRVPGPEGKRPPSEHSEERGS